MDSYKLASSDDMAALDNRHVSKVFAINNNNEDKTDERSLHLEESSDTETEATGDGLDFGGEDVELRNSQLDEDKQEEDSCVTEQLGGLARISSGKLASAKEKESFCEQPLSEEEAVELMPIGDGGLIWKALVVPNDFVQEGELLRGLPKRDFDVETRTIKSRRKSLPITCNDFFRSLTRVNGPCGPRWIFHGMLNRWPGLTCLELISLQARRQERFFVPSVVSPKDVLTGEVKWVHYWTADKEGRTGVDPAIHDEDRVYRAKLRGAPWTAKGWSEDSPGFVFWYQPQNSIGSQITYGTRMIAAVSDTDICTMVHMVSHRYANAKESPKDRLTYHSIVLLEWDHGEYCTVVEGAYLNGVGGYKGKSNWYDDKDEPVTELFRAIPSEMICPWLTSSAEIRCYDVKAKNLDELIAYMKKYEGSRSRFVDPQCTFSHCARLSYRSKRNIAQYCLNYISRDFSYDELKRNCQTFAADCCAFIAGKKSVDPFHPVNRIQYENRTYLFLYESSMYVKKRGQSGRNKKS